MECPSDPIRSVPIRQRRSWLSAALVLITSGIFLKSPLYGQTSIPAQPPVVPKSTLTVERSPTTPPSTTEQVIKLTLKEAIQLALQQNLDIMREELSPQITRTFIEQERSEFDPLASLVTSLSQTKVLPENEVILTDPATGQRSGTITIESFSKDGEVTPRLQQRLLIGSTYELEFVNTRSNIAPAGAGSARRIDDPRYESRFILTFTQPLLRDFGISVNSTFIRQAEKFTEIAEQEALQTILDIVFEVQQSYWTLVFRIRDLEARREALKLAQDFLADNKVRVELKVLAPVELIQAETQVKFREGVVISAEAAVEEAEDRLKEILNLPERVGTWRLSIRPSDEPPFVSMAELSVDEQVTIALQQRPDFLQSQLDIASREIQRDFDKNQLLPRLDLIGQGSLQTFGGNYGDSIGNLGDADGYQWLIGVQVAYPLGNRFSRNRLVQRNLEIKQAVFDQRILKLSIVRQVRQAVRDIKTTGKRVEVTQASTRLAETQLKTEQEKFRVGLSNSFLVIQFQDELTDARIEEIFTLTNYNVALARLDQLTGTMRYGKATTDPHKVMR
jgi:outer membrane protein TolC